MSIRSRSGGIASPVLTCANCGRENPLGAKFCMECATALGAHHDPEILLPILGSYFDEMRDAVERHGGRVQSSSAPSG